MATHNGTHTMTIKLKSGCSFLSVANPDIVVSKYSSHKCDKDLYPYSTLYTRIAVSWGYVGFFEVIRECMH